ncbi:MAG: hypothetical protein ACTTH7_04540 [Treponema sp.]
MDLGTLVLLIKNVILDPKVIAITIVLVLYLKLVLYVAYYKKAAAPSFKAQIKKNLKPQEQASGAEHTE